MMLFCPDAEFRQNRGVTPNYTTQTTLFPWDFNVPISCGEALVIPGDVVIADDVGVVVPAAMINEVADKALEHEDWERFSRIKLTEGGDLMKYYPLDEEAQAEFQQWKLSNNWSPVRGRKQNDSNYRRKYYLPL